MRKFNCLLMSVLRLIGGKLHAQPVEETGKTRDLPGPPISGAPTFRFKSTRFPAGTNSGEKGGTSLGRAGTNLDPAGTRLCPAGTNLDPAGTHSGPAGTSLDPAGIHLGPAVTSFYEAITSLATAQTSADAAGNVKARVPTNITLITNGIGNKAKKGGGFSYGNIPDCFL